MSESDGLGSGTSGLVFGVRATTRAAIRDAAAGAFDLAALRQPRLRRAAARWPRRRVLAISVQRTDVPNVLPAAREELLRSRHEVTFAYAGAGDRGRFENLNALLAEHPAVGHDWLLVIDDDVALPRGFLDAFVFLSERFQLRLAQPAHRAHSHDQHWSALALQYGWRIGVVDATPIRHGLRRIAASYGHDEAMAEARRFLDGRPYTAAADAQRTLVMHRSWS